MSQVVSQEVKPPRYQVVAPMVVAKTTTTEGVKLLNFYQRAILPGDVPADQIERFLRRRLIVQIGENGVPVEAAPPAQPAKGGRPPKTAG